jgi:AAA+ ATPase superfamily predicted ATPase
MLFSDRPKERREELFDRDDEISELKRASNHPITLVTGPRRIGKTSLLRVYLNEENMPSALVDVRSPTNSYRALSLFHIFLYSYTAIKNRLLREVKKLLCRVKGDSFAGFNISLSWESRPSLHEIMNSINSLGRVLIAFDKAQNLRGKLATNFISLLAHCYDYCSTVNFILTVSEVGLLYDLLGIYDAESPLYGRHLDEGQQV